MIKGVEDMEAYIATEGMVRFCTEEYKDPKPKQECDSDGEELYNFDEDNLLGHLTNYTLNKESSKYVNNKNQQGDGTKRLFTKVMKVMEEEGVDLEKFNAELDDICTKLVYALRPQIVNTYHHEVGQEGMANQNCFHILGLDLMMDTDHKLWVLEINAFPSFNYFFDKIVTDPITKKRKRVKTVSELDKYLKTLIVKEACLIWRDEVDKGDAIFKKIYPPSNLEGYGKYSIYDDIRKAFERITYPHNPDFMSLAQFESIAEMADSRLEELTDSNYSMSLKGKEGYKKPEKYEYNSKLLTKSLLRNYYKQYAKSGNKSMMNLSQFTKALDGLAKTLYPAFYSKFERMSRIVEEVLRG